MRYLCVPGLYPCGQHLWWESQMHSYFVIDLLFLKNLFIAVRLVTNSDSFMGLEPCGLDLSLQEIHIDSLILLILPSYGL